VTKLIVANSLNLAYVILPKCACTSIKSYICSADPNNPLQIDENYTTKALEGIFGPYTTDIGASINLSAYGDYLRFTFVRDPVSRLVSLYNEKVRSALYPPLADFGVKPGMSFQAFAEVICAVPDELADDHFCSQSFMIAHEGEVLVDLLAPIERTGELLPGLLTLSGHPWNGPTFHHRLTSKTFGRDDLSVRVRQLILDRYSADAALHEQVSVAPMISGRDDPRLQALKALL